MNLFIFRKENPKLPMEQTKKHIDFMLEGIFYERAAVETCGTPEDLEMIDKYIYDKGTEYMEKFHAMNSRELRKFGKVRSVELEKEIMGSEIDDE